MRSLQAAIYTILIFAIALSISLGLSTYRYIPTCPEDAVLVGTGQFEDGRWTSYECGPAVDDYDWSR